MSLTAAQLTTLKADILANTDPAVTTALANGDSGAVATWYNLEASPAYHIYKQLVSSDEIRDVIDAVNIVNITAADLDRVQALLEIRADRGFSGANARDRLAWDDVFSSATGDESQQAIAALWTRLATNAEKVFALSTGNGASAATADTTSFQGSLSFQDINAALQS